MLVPEDARIAVIGLGYVGLPLAVAFGRRYPTVGFDISPARIAELEAGDDSTLEVPAEELVAAERLSYARDVAEASSTIHHEVWPTWQEFGDVLRGVNNWYRTGWAIADIADVVIIARLHSTVGSRAHHDLPFIDAVPAFSKLADGELTPQRSLAVLEHATAEVREIQSLLTS